MACHGSMGKAAVLCPAAGKLFMEGSKSKLAAQWTELRSCSSQMKFSHLGAYGTWTVVYDLLFGPVSGP